MPGDTEAPRAVGAVVGAVAGAVLALHLVCSPAAADMAALTAVKDNTLYESAGGSFSNGVGSYLFVGKTNVGEIRRALVAFDVAGTVPANSTINSVTLRLNMSKTIAGPHAVSLHTVTKNWGEGTSNADGPEGMGAGSTAGDATWIHSVFPGTTWTNAGGDFGATVRGLLFVDQNGQYTWPSTPQMVADVQSWLDAPATNFGWLLKGNEASLTTAKRFDSREAASAANRPTLVIDFTPPMMPTVRRSWGSIKAAYR